MKNLALVLGLVAMVAVSSVKADEIDKMLSADPAQRLKAMVALHEQLDYAVKHMGGANLKELGLAAIERAQRAGIMTERINEAIETRVAAKLARSNLGGRLGAAAMIVTAATGAALNSPDAQAASARTNDASTRIGAKPKIGQVGKSVTFKEFGQTSAQGSVAGTK